MLISDAQREVREVYRNGAVGQAVSGAIWLISAALATWTSPRSGIIMLVVGGAMIFPLTQLALKACGRRASLGASNPLRELAMEVAFIVPLCLPLVAAAALHRLEWFYPAMMVVVGAHYLPFAFLYGMRAFLPLGGAMIAGGVALGMTEGVSFSAGGWATGAALVLFAIIAPRLQR